MPTAIRCKHNRLPCLPPPPPPIPFLTDDIADLTVGLAIAVVRKIPQGDHYMRAILSKAKGDNTLTTRVGFGDQHHAKVATAVVDGQSSSTSTDELARQERSGVHGWTSLCSHPRHGQSSLPSSRSRPGASSWPRHLSVYEGEPNMNISLFITQHKVAGPRTLPTFLTDAEAKRFKAKKSSDENGSCRKDAEADSRNATKAVDQNPPPPKQGFIHVRARRGQATDSHSLAERARREKITERMKILQDPVPECNKVSLF